MSPSHHQINIIWTNQKLTKGKKKTPSYLPKIKLECTYVYTRKGFYKNQGTNYMQNALVLEIILIFISHQKNPTKPHWQ